MSRLISVLYSRSCPIRECLPSRIPCRGFAEPRIPLGLAASVRRRHPAPILSHKAPGKLCSRIGLSVMVRVKPKISILLCQGCVKMHVERV
jgi:hypothetical protein